MSFQCARGCVVLEGSRPRLVATSVRQVVYPIRLNHKFKHGEIRFKTSNPTGTEAEAVEVLCIKHLPEDDLKPEILFERVDWDQELEIEVSVPFRKPIQILDPSALAEAEIKQAAWLAKQEKRTSPRQRSSLSEEDLY